jgi:hypothetical protein
MEKCKALLYLNMPDPRFDPIPLAVYKCNGRHYEGMHSFEVEIEGKKFILRYEEAPV